MARNSRSVRVPQQERSRQTVARLLAAAGQVFVEQGFAATTTNHIAERAGLSVGSLYQFFPDKHAVLSALQAEWAVRLGVALDEALADAAEQPLEVSVDRVLRVHARLNSDPPGLLCFLLTLPEHPSQTEALLRTMVQRVEELLAVLAVPMSPVRRRMVALMVIHLSMGLYALGDVSAAKNPEIFRETKDAMLGYLTPLGRAAG
ncbi:TetR/AcrR family transcriptional regulator [Streptacidiphilus sp. PAMC 29251]